MAKKEFMLRGKTLEELQDMGYKELAAYLPSAARRKIKRGFTDEEKKFIEGVKKKKGNIKTHLRDMIILPEWVGKRLMVHGGKSFENVVVEGEMIGHRLGEFVLTRKKIAHSAPGVGATRSSSALSVR